MLDLRILVLTPLSHQKRLGGVRIFAHEIAYHAHSGAPSGVLTRWFGGAGILPGTPLRIANGRMDRPLIGEAQSHVKVARMQARAQGSDQARRGWPSIGSAPK